jgi:hypothetical protein
MERLTVGTGTNLPWVTAAALDLDRNRRLIGRPADMGCYETSPQGAVYTMR